VFDTGVRPVFALPKLTVAALGALLVLLLGLAGRVAGRSGPRWANTLTVPVGLVLAWTAVSAAAAPDPWTSVVGAPESLNGRLTAATLGVHFFAAAQAFDVDGVKTAISVLWFGGAGVVLSYGAVQLADRLWAGGRLDPVPWVNPLGERAIWSTLGNPNDLAGFLAVLLPIGLVLLAVERRPGWRALTASMLAVLFVELAATTARGAVLAAAAAVVVVAVRVGPETTRRLRRGTAAVFLAAVAVAALVIVGGHGERDPAVLLRAGEGTTASLRLELWGTAWRMVADNPLFGVGPDRFALAFDGFRSDRFVRVYGPELLATDAHNVLLTAAATQGFPGLAALSLLLGSAVAVVVRARRRLGGEGRALLAAIGAALLAYVVQALFNRQDIALDFCFWVLLGLACALARPSGAAGPKEGGEGDHSSEGTDDEGDPGDRVAPAVPAV
jgi:O-antigen ligase